MLLEISHRRPPSRFLQESMAAPKVVKQLGTLGGGNHFLEVVYDETGRVWIMLHSGSRNVGNSTAQHYDRVANQQLTRQGLKAPGGLNYFQIDSEEGQQYLQVRYAHARQAKDLDCLRSAVMLPCQLLNEPCTCFMQQSAWASVIL